MSDYFDLDTAAKSADLSDADLQRLRDLMRREFPDDPMMQDLHVLRACMAISDGRVTLAEALRAHVDAAV